MIRHTAPIGWCPRAGGAMSATATGRHRTCLVVLTLVRATDESTDAQPGTLPVQPRTPPARTRALGALRRVRRHCPTTSPTKPPSWFANASVCHRRLLCPQPLRRLRRRRAPVRPPRPPVRPPAPPRAPQKDVQAGEMILKRLTKHLNLRRKQPGRSRARKQNAMFFNALPSENLQHAGPRAPQQSC